MGKTIYSHAFLVGTFNSELKPEQLDKSLWKQEIVSLDGEIKRYKRDKGYNGLCTLYYKAHLDAMLEALDVKRPDFLNSVHHYVNEIEKAKNDDKDFNSISLSLEKGAYPKKVAYEYTFKLCRLHLYFFPLDIVLFAIEIDDTGTELDNLTAAHSFLMGCWEADSFGSKKLSGLMMPLVNYLDKNGTGRLTKDGNKLKIFQTVKIQSSQIENELLYEIGTSSPIGCVKGGTRLDMKPAESYFDKIMDENSVATFDNWKGLALVDSFTILGKEDSFDESDCNFLYFPLIYLRCIFEKAFCFSRNNAFREDKAGKHLIWEIEQMEKYYFYDNISYNFQPNLLYQAMAKGLSIKEERDVLSKQIKDQEEKRFDKILAYVAIFAVFSVVWDICSIVLKAFPCLNNYYSSYFAGICILGGFIVAILFVCQIRKRRNNNLLSKCFFSLYGKMRKFLCIARTKRIIIPKEVREHLVTHFRQGLPGSKFYSSSPEILIDEAMRLFPETFSNTKPGSDGKIKLSIVFPGEIGVSNVMSIDELTDEEKDRIEIIDRNGKMVRSVKTGRVVPTRECQIILSEDWHLITMFPGEMAPPLPDSPDVPDDYWDNHVFIEPIK